MTLSGVVAVIGDIEKGQSKSGKPWQKRTLVLSFARPDNMKDGMAAFTLFGEKKMAMIEGLAEGEMVKVSFDVDSREYKGRYYTELNAWRVEPAEDCKSAKAQASGTPTSFDGPQPDDDLPF